MYSRLIIIFIITLLTLIINSNYISKNDIELEHLKTEIKCNYDILEKEIVGNSMLPLLKNLGKINLYINYYKNCNIKPQKGDFIAYNYTGYNHPLIKIIKADENDIITYSGSHILVNNEELINSIGEIYSFNDEEIKKIMFFVNKGKLPINSYLIFGDNVLNSIDSRRFGAVNKNDFYGKFEQIINNK